MKGEKGAGCQGWVNARTNTPSAVALVFMLLFFSNGGMDEGDGWRGDGVIGLGRVAVRGVRRVFGCSCCCWWTVMTHVTVERWTYTCVCVCVCVCE